MFHMVKNESTKKTQKGNKTALKFRVIIGKIVKFCLFLTTICIGINHLYAEEIDVTQPLRINDFIPRKNLACVLAVEPALPDNFISLNDTNELGYLDWLYWGPKDAIETYMKDPSSLTTPIIRIRLSDGIMQREFGRLDEALITKEEPELTNSTYNFGNWGEYPYCMISCTIEDDGKTGNLIVGYVGLNHESGAVLFLHLVVPETSTGKAEALRLWENFFKNTKELPIPLLYKAKGQELHPGYTIVNIFENKIKVIAEKRRSDQKIRFVSIPEKPDVEFKFEKMFVTTMGDAWHYREPLLKIRGAYIVNDGSVHYSLITSVLIKEVDEFTQVPTLKKNVFIKML